MPVKGRGIALAAAIATLALSGCSTDRAPHVMLGDRFPLGRSTTGEPCTAAWRWNDPRASGPNDRSYTISCSSVAASRVVGTISAVPVSRASMPVQDEGCGAPAALTLKDIGPVEVRRCQDMAIGAGAVEIRFTRDGRAYRGAALPYLLAPLEAGLRAVAGVAPPPKAGMEAAPAAIDLAAVPEGGGKAAVATGFAIETALQQGIALNRQGRSAESSRVLNDALSRLPADTAPDIRIEVALEAALADSNSSVFAAADEHFAQADALVAANPRLDRLALLTYKRGVYRAFDRINRGEPREALAEVARLDAAMGTQGSFPLQDPAVLRPLNRPAIGRGNAARSLTGTDASRVELDVFHVQQLRARSLAAFALGDLRQSEAAIVQAEGLIGGLLADRVSPAPLAWLVAGVERQHARILARREDWKGAIVHLDAALHAVDAAGGSFDFAGPAIADARTDRADYLRRSGAPLPVVLAEYQKVIDALAASGAGTVALSSIDRYLDLLIEQKGSLPDADERFFRAMQVISTPAVARQSAELQNVVTADPALAARYRQRTEAERELRRLTFEIASFGADAAPGDKNAAATAGPTLADLQSQRAAAQDRLDRVVGELAADPRYRAVDDSPATIAELRRRLRPGEVYLKLTALRARTYGIVLTGSTVSIYALDAPTAAVTALAATVRKSIDGDGDSLRPFNVSSAYALFALIAGPAAQDMLAAKAIVIDPAGPLEAVPAGVLVTDRASVDWYVANRKRDPFDFSQVAFLASRAELSTALSPRSFLITRGLPQSAAARPLLGLGSHLQPPADARTEAAARAAAGVRCSTGAEVYRAIWNATPISAREIGIAADALGDARAPTVTGDQFTDAALRDRSDLDQYEVLHFATHGLPEMQVGCADIPPSLVTSLGGTDSDGLLSFDEIARLHLDANLVVLSACETAGQLSAISARRSGQEDAGQLAGLVRAFLAAQARAVVATMWQVPAGAESDQLIGAFYAAGKSERIGAALRAAQVALIRQPSYSHPFHWGAYILVGDGAKTMLRGTTATASR